MLKPKRALVTGACGFSASFLIDLLLKKGWDIVATDLKTAPRDNLEGKNVEFIAADLTDKASLKNVVKDIDIVFHTAAIMDFSTPMEVLRAVNVQGTKNLLETVVNSNVHKVVSWSSVALYGSADPKWYKLPITENQELNPVIKEKYGLSKREQEAGALKLHKEHGLPLSFIRCGAIYGPRTYYGMYTLFRIIKMGMLPVLSKNLHKGSIPLVHGEDIARVGLFLSDVNKFNGEAYNVIDDNTLDIVQTLRFIAFITDQHLKILPSFPIKLLKPFFKLLGKWSLWEANHLRKKVNGKSPIPKFETETMGYVYGNYWYSNQKILDAGYSFKYGDRKIGLLETIKWCNEQGWPSPRH